MRVNRTMHKGMRRFTRRTSGFSKKVENLEHAVSLHFLHDNFARIYETLRVTPGDGRRDQRSRSVAGRDRRLGGLTLSCLSKYRQK